MGALLAQGAYRLLADPLQRLYGYCDHVAYLLSQPGVPKSCLLGNLTQEMAETHPKIQAVCQAGFAAWVDSLCVALDEARTQHAPLVAFDSQNVAAHFLVIFEGALILGKAQQNAETVRLHLEHFKHYLSLLFGVEQYNL
jgi:TetR/AcrR family transcriptional repressor of nem operon